MTPPSPPPGPPPPWLGTLDLALVRRLVGGRALDLALTSGLRYERSPFLSAGAVVAVLQNEGSDALIRVELRITPGDSSLLGDCARCVPTFGACVHAATLAFDLAASVPLRDALLEGTSTRGAAARAPGLRRAKELELKFDGALRGWLATAAEGMRVQIAASPFAEVDAFVGRAYGDRGDPVGTRFLSIFVRRAGEKKLLSPRDIVVRSDFGARDRRVLTHAKERGSGRKAVYAAGVEASLAIEAMHAHGGVFAAGYKALLDFRAAPMRPAVDLCPSLPFDALTAFWIADGTEVRIPFGDAVFFPGPFPFVWTKSGAIYRVAKGVDLDFANQLAQAPVLHVPPGKLKDAGARLLRATRGRGITLPSHEAFGLPAVEVPRVALRLAGSPLRIEGDLVAIYRAREVSLYPTGASAFVAVPDEGRDLETEAHARALVEQAGLVRRDASDDDGAEGEHAPVEPHIALADDDAITFWQKGLALLRAAEDPRIDVQLSEPLARVRVGAPITGRVHVVLEGDWLDTRLEFASKELPVEIDAIRAALARKQRWVTLSDGTLTRISASIESLTAEAREVMGKETKARLPAHQLGRLDRWIEDNDGRMDAAVDALRQRLHALAVAAEPEMPKGLHATLRPYQRLGLAWLQFLQALGAGGILADDMGLGKTITTLAFLLKRKEAEGPAPTLVVCPTSVATNWVREAARFTPGLRVLLLHGPSPGARARGHAAIAESDLVITTYALLRRDLEALAQIKFRCAVLDEAQNIKNADSATKRAASRLDATMRLALTGTPIENRLRELWSIASFVNPGMLGTSRAFETRFERPIAADRKSPVADELRAIVRPFLLRRTKDDVLPELPPKTEIDRDVTLSSADKRMYDALAHTLRASLAKDLENRGPAHTSLGVFTALTRLRQMACDPRLVDPRLPASRSAKREAFMELVRELVAEGRRALVFSQFVSLLTLWRKDLDAEQIAYEYLDGGTTKRDEVVTRFQEGSAPLFLISLKAGGAGLNLTAADTVIHCDPWWNPAVEDQATDRAYRIGQDKPVTVVRLVARGTIEEKILSLKAKKRELTSVVIGDDARALEGITQDDIRALLGDANASIDPESEGEERSALSPTDTIATASRVVSPEFHSVVAQAKRWLAETGQPETELAEAVGIPVPYATRLALGEPFPCSRAVAERIRTRLLAWR